VKSNSLKKIKITNKNKHMKKLFSLLFASVFALAVQAQFNAEKDPFLVKSLSNESLQKVLVETSGGSINVEGVAASEARIEVYVRANNWKDNAGLSKDELQKRLDENYTLEVAVSGGQLTAIAKQRQKINFNWKKGLSISFKVYVTKNIATKLSTSGGSIALLNLDGVQDFKTSGGSLSVDNLTGKITGRTSGGSISLRNTKDEIDLSTSGGSIDAKGCSGNIQLNTSGGSLTLRDLKGKVDARTSGGSVNGDNIEGELYAHTSGGSVNLERLACSVDASTSGGNIDVEITKLGEYVKLSNSGGNVALQLPKDKGVNLDLHGDKIKVDPLTNFSGSKEDDELTGTLNGGGALVKVRAGSGRITLTMK
jgi:DUF4097 and DUF4098 domain-containing protein YvlB